MYVKKFDETTLTGDIYRNEILQKFVEDGEFSQLQTEYIVGREFKGDNYPNWSADAKEYYMTNGMLVALGVTDGELYGINQIYVP